MTEKSKKSFQIIAKNSLRHTVLSGLFTLASFAATDAMAASASDFKTAEYNRGWQLSAIGAADAYARGFTGAGQIVAVFDSGMNKTHEDLNANISGVGFDAVTGLEGVASDVNGHGTFVSGIIAGERNGLGAQGIAYNSKILTIRIVNADGSVSLSDNKLATAIRYATSHGAGVMNNSWNTSTQISAVTKAGLDGFMGQTLQAYREAVKANRIIVFAAGNEGKSQPGFYAALPKLYSELTAGWISAVAIDGTGAIASYSNRCGDTAAWCLAAPGSAVVSTMRNANNSYGTGSGTSFAAPVISGAAAVLKQQWPKLTNAQIKAILFKTATKTGIYANSAVYGQGLLNLEAATRPVGTTTTPTPTPTTPKPTTPTTPTTPKPVTPTSPTTGSGSKFGRGFGTYGRSAKSAEQLRIITFDEFGRDFYMDSAAFFSNAMPSFDSVSALRDFNNGMETTTIGQTTYGFANADTKTTIGGAQFDGVRMFIETPVAGTTTTAAFNINPSLVFGLAPRDVAFAGKLVDGEALVNPYMSLAKNPITVAAKANLSDDVWVKGGSFFGEQATDLNAPVTLSQDPNYSKNLGKVYGGVAEIGTTFGTKHSGFAFTGGFVNEQNAMLGSISSGVTKLADSTNTMFAGVSAKVDLGGGLNAFGGFEMGWSKVQSARSSLVENVSDINSQSFRAGLTKTGVIGKSDTFGFVVSEPLRVNNATMNLNMADSQNADGSVNFHSSTADISAEAHELDLQAFYTTEVNEKGKFAAGLLLRENAGHVAGQSEAIAMARYKLSF
ncbi:MAG: S8 family peptidase [Alphaproteobacteria bacterium]|nr:S8 family peptidase [Alphaproteobacteria bacterium]